MLSQSNPLSPRVAASSCHLLTMTGLLPSHCPHNPLLSAGPCILIPYADHGRPAALACHFALTTFPFPSVDCILMSVADYDRSSLGLGSFMVVCDEDEAVELFDQVGRRFDCRV